MSVSVEKSRYHKTMKNSVMTPPMMPGKKLCSHFKTLLRINSSSRYTSRSCFTLLKTFFWKIRKIRKIPPIIDFSFVWMDFGWKFYLIDFHHFLRRFFDLFQQVLCNSNCWGSFHSFSTISFTEFKFFQFFHFLFSHQKIAFFSEWVKIILRN